MVALTFPAMCSSFVVALLATTLAGCGEDTLFTKFGHHQAEQITLHPGHSNWTEAEWKEAARIRVDIDEDNPTQKQIVRNEFLSENNSKHWSDSEWEYAAEIMASLTEKEPDDWSDQERMVAKQFTHEEVPTWRSGHWTTSECYRSHGVNETDMAQLKNRPAYQKKSGPSFNALALLFGLKVNWACFPGWSITVLGFNYGRWATEQKCWEFTLIPGAIPHYIFGGTVVCSKGRHIRTEMGWKFGLAFDVVKVGCEVSVSGLWMWQHGQSAFAFQQVLDGGIGAESLGIEPTEVWRSGRQWDNQSIAESGLNFNAETPQVATQSYRETFLEYHGPWSWFGLNARDASHDDAIAAQLQTSSSSHGAKPSSMKPGEFRLLQFSKPNDAQCKTAGCKVTAHLVVIGSGVFAFVSWRRMRVWWTHARASRWAAVAVDDDLDSQMKSAFE